MPLPVLLPVEPLPLDDAFGGQFADVLPGGQSAELAPLVEDDAPALPVAELPVPALLLPEVPGVLLGVDGVAPALPLAEVEPDAPVEPEALVPGDVPDCAQDSAASANKAALVAVTRSLTLMLARPPCSVEKVKVRAAQATTQAPMM